MSAPDIMPSSWSMRGKEVKLFAADQSCVWATTAGSLFNDSACTSAYAGALSTQVYLKARNVSGDYTLTATNGSAESDVAPVEVEGVCPTHPSWQFRGTHDKVILSWTPDSGAADRQEREKRGLKYRCDFQAGTRQKAELEEFLEFFGAHYGKRKNFIYVHPGTGTEYESMFDAPLAEQWELNNLVGYSTVVQEV